MSCKKKAKILTVFLINLTIFIIFYPTTFNFFISLPILSFANLGDEKALEQQTTIKINRRFAVFGCSTPGEKSHRGFDYTFYLPLTVAAWERIGYETIVLIIGDKREWQINPVLAYVLDFLDQLNNVTVLFIPAKVDNRMMISQTARIFVANMEAFPGHPSDFIITTDSDLWPLRKEHFNQPEDLNRPLTIVHSKCCGHFSFGGRSYTMLPMSHIKASADTWRQIINKNVSTVAKDSVAILDYFEDIFGERVRQSVVFASDNWYLDQKLVSIRVDEWISRQTSKDECVYEVSDDGFYRIDRSSWNEEIIQSSLFAKYYDSHLPLNGFLPAIWNTIKPLIKNMYGENSSQYEWCNHYATGFHNIYYYFYTGKKVTHV